MPRDLYEILGVARSATPDEIKKAYRKLARQYHPDVNKEAGVTEQFQEINAAYEVLSDEEKRARYDRFGLAGVTGQQGGNGAFTGDLNDIFEQFFSGFGGTTTRTGRKQPRAGRDLRYDLTISLRNRSSAWTSRST